MKRVRDREIIHKIAMEHNINMFITDLGRLEINLTIYQKGELIQRAQEQFKSLKLCISGEFEVSSISPTGKYFTISKEKAPNLIGETTFASGSGSTGAMNAVALTEVVCIELPAEENREALMSDVTFLQFLCKTMAQKLVEGSYQYEKLVQNPPESRLSAFLLISENHDMVDMHLGKASQSLGISYRHTMRILHDFCNRGLLERGSKKGTYMITDRKALESISTFHNG